MSYRESDSKYFLEEHVRRRLYLCRCFEEYGINPSLIRYATRISETHKLADEYKSYWVKELK